MATDDPQVNDFAESDLVDIRRFCGYPAYAGDIGLNYEADFFALELRLANMNTAEQSVITTTFLPILRTLETAITSAGGSTLSVDTAGPFKRNANELTERQNLYSLKRRELCAFIGVRPDPSIMGGGSVIRT